MGIDRIGKGGGAAPPLAPAEAGGADALRAPRAAEPTAAFQVRAPETEASSAVAPALPTPLDRLKSGEVDVHGYMDLKVEEATTHLSGLSTTELTAVRKMLRDQLATDPGFADLVEQATGRAPTPPEE